MIFNNLLTAARNPIECAFSRLKARWAILTREIDFKLKTIPKLVYTCSVLHNFCEKNNVTVDQDAINNQIEFIQKNETELQNIPDPIYSYNEEERIIVRATLTKLIHVTLK